MEEIQKLLKERQIELLEMQKKKRKELLKAPEGSLHISHGKRKTQYYWRQDKKDTNGIYIPKDNYRLAEKLAQKDYNKKVLKAAEMELKAIEQFQKFYPKHNIEEIYEQLHPIRKDLVFPIRESDEAFVKEWTSVEYEGKGFYDDYPEFYTSKGERVRSKSEWMIANLLYQSCIPYRYEYPVYLQGMGVVYPDFTILNVRLRKEMYLEHMGLMDDPEYATKALNKIILYEQNGIFQGEQLVITHETARYPLNPKHVQFLIEHYFQ